MLFFSVYITTNSLEGIIAFIYSLLICILVICMRLTLLYNLYPNQLQFYELNSIDF